MESTLGVHLPGDYKALLRRANGQRNWSTISFPPDRLAFLGADDVLALWAEMNEYVDNEYFDEFWFDDKIRAILHHPRRIPIAYYEAGQAFLWLDMVPGPNGHEGQLVFNIGESECVLLEDGVGVLLQRYADLLQSGLVSVAAEQSPDDPIAHEIKARGRFIDYDAYVELRQALAT
jgi:cell wall assembly regulator SMI1